MEECHDGVSSSDDFAWEEDGDGCPDGGSDDGVRETSDDQPRDRILRGGREGGRRIVNIHMEIDGGCVYNMEERERE